MTKLNKYIGYLRNGTSEKHKFYQFSEWLKRRQRLPKVSRLNELHILMISVTLPFTVRIFYLYFKQPLYYQHFHSKKNIAGLMKVC